MARVTVIGGAGRMGAWFANFLAANGYKVIICDKSEFAARKLAKRHGFKYVRSETQAAELANIIILATPTYTTASILRRILPHISNDALLVEISSIKEPLVPTIRSLTKHGADILSIHPMFGPGAKNLEGKAILVAQEPRRNTSARDLLSIFRKKGANIIRTTLNDHDRIVASTLGLPHLMNFAFIETLKQAGLSLRSARAMGGTTFGLQLLIAESLYHEGLHNEASILAAKYCRQAAAAFAERVSQLKMATHRSSQNELAKRIRNDAAYVRKDPMFRDAYELFAAAVEASTHN